MRTRPTNLLTFSAELKLAVPTSWRELSDKMLLYYAFLSATYEPELAKATFLMRLLNIKVVKSVGKDRYICRYKGRDVILQPVELSLALDQLKFLDHQMAVRTATMQGYTAVNALLQDEFTFFEYLRTDTFFQMYLRTEKEQFVVRMANFLYRNDAGKYAAMRTLTVAEQAVVLLWWVGAKTELAKAFPKYFGPAPSADETDVASLQQNIMEANDAQIRALTGGDVTKEQDVLQMQCWRCFAELNAKAREAEELRKMYNKK